MNRISHGGIAATALLVAACAAQPDGSARSSGDTVGSAVERAGPGGNDMPALLEARVRVAERKFLQLADAIPEGRYDWRPMEGVRSVREVLIHIAADNWAPVWMDVQAPEDVPVTRDMASLGAYQEQRLGKAETLVELRRSFEFLLSALDQTRTRLDERVTFGGREWGVGEMWVALVTHMHEHLGQLVAYARTNEIVPPWSRE